ncbi:Rrf2 family transcriptional regulator [Parvularcula marina]|uniref:RrF2 family transcriptional regulator n=1 Tax=Parvularcula marina TaxID=2292771 RepID=UPI0035178C47
MKLTSRARNAVAAMADMAAFGGDVPVPLSDIAVRQGLSLAFLEQIFGQLRKAGLVTSRRGAGGGYLLAQSSAEISVGAIVDAVDEEIRSTACVPGAATGCTGSSTRCLTHKLWHGLDREIETYLGGITLADIAAGANAPLKERAAHA